MRDDLERYWRELAGMAQTMPFDALARAADVLFDCYIRGGTIYVLGNGGSAATASHFACDLAKGTRTNGVPTFRVVALTDNAALMTAWANDTSYERVFAEQLAALVRPGDVVVAISASGASPNVLLAVEVAKQAGAATVAMTGPIGGRLRELADVAILTPEGSIEQVEDLHLAMSHSLCVALRVRVRDDTLEFDTALGALQPVAIEMNR
jgi:D-sedoheptulose 7-phosphate isomerase